MKTLKPRVLIVDDEVSMREMLSILLERHGYEVMTAGSKDEVVRILEAGERFDGVVTDLLMDQGSGIDVLIEVKKVDPGCEVILITAYGTAETAVEAMKKGAYDYIAKPFSVDEFLIVLRQALERRALIQENIDLKKQVRGKFIFNDIIGRSAAMREVIDMCRKVADSMATILLTGESGVGKEVVSRAIHFGGGRSNESFVAVNCGAIPEHLIESELFGHVKGSFTGATEDRQGLFSAADKGTIFLDEISELPLPLQVKMLRVLQERMIRPVGGGRELPVDVRVIAATNQNLEAQVEQGEFRQDLFYRLNVIQIHVPPLRERVEDIPPLVDHFLGRLATEGATVKKNISSDAMRALVKYAFPGNARELSNMLERAAVLTVSSEIEVTDLPRILTEHTQSGAVNLITLTDDGINLDEVISQIEHSLITQALKKTRGVRTKAASLLGVSFRSLRYRLQKMGLDKSDHDQD